MTTTNKLMIALALVILVGLSIGIAVSASQNAKNDKRTANIAAGLGVDGQGGFNAKPYTDSLYLDFTQNAKCDTKLYADLYKLTDDNIRAIFLDWSKRYQSKKENEKRSLAQALYYAYSGYFVTGWVYANTLYSRLITLGLE